MVIYFVLIYTFFVASFLYVLLFGQSEFHAKGYVGKLNICLTALPQKCLTSVCGKNCYENSENWCCMKKNPLLQIVYLVILATGFFVFLRNVWTEIPNPLVPSYHKVTSIISVFLTYISFMVACYSDPGIVTPQNEKIHHKTYHYDYMMYIPKVCSTTKVIRPARAKTCRVCNQCVSKFDHHCAWINNDVGANNYRYFLTFLFCTAWIAIYATYLCGAVLIGIVFRDKLLDSVFVTPSGEKVQASIAIVIQYLLHFHMLTIALLFFAVAVGITISGFLIYHLYLTATNITTNETFKWKEVKWQIDALKEGLSPEEVVPDYQPGDTTSHRAIQLKTLQIVAKNNTKLVNTYSKGLIGNFWEVFYPLASRNLTSVTSTTSIKSTSTSSSKSTTTKPSKFIPKDSSKNE